MLKKTKEDWNEKHRNVARKLFLEGGWLQKPLFDIGWSDESECQACHEEEGTEKAQAPPLSMMVRDQERERACRKEQQKTKTLKRECEWQRCILTHPLCESRWNRGHFSIVGAREAQKLGHASRRFQRPLCHGRLSSGYTLESGEHVAGQFDYDEESGPLHGMYGLMEAELEVQRTSNHSKPTQHFSSSSSPWSRKACQCSDGSTERLEFDRMT